MSKRRFVYDESGTACFNADMIEQARVVAPVAVGGKWRVVFWVRGEDTPVLISTQDDQHEALDALYNFIDVLEGR